MNLIDSNSLQSKTNIQSKVLDSSQVNENSQTDEAEKVEESLRDFIGKIITYYEKFNVKDSLLNKYETKISNAETLLEVFDIMKEMFDDLMDQVSKNPK